jgi:hypothetical protein
MRFRQAKNLATDRDEQQLEEEVRRLAAGEPQPSGPSDAYWPNLLVRVNSRIDEATSGKALSLSWAYRVAIPGVFAILAFFIGLKYYAPAPELRKTSLEAVVLSLPSQSADSLVVHPERVDPSLSVEEVINSDPLEVPRDAAADYFIEHGGSTVLMESMSEEQVSAVLAVLGSGTSGQD